MMTTAQEFERRRWIALALLCFAQFIVVLDASIVNVALPSIGKGLDFSQAEPPLGRERLRAHLRRLPAARRANGGPAGTPARLHRRTPPRRRGLARRRLRRHRGSADRRPRRPGPRRGDHLALGALDRHHHLPRRRRAQQGARAPGARSPERAAPPACSSEGSSPMASAGSGCCGSTCRWRSSSPRSPRA